MVPGAKMDAAVRLNEDNAALCWPLGTLIKEREFPYDRGGTLDER